MKNVFFNVFVSVVLGIVIPIVCSDELSSLPFFEDQKVTMITRGDISPSNAAYTISRPGIYTLTSAKTASGVPNIFITANNVTLDLGGNTLTGGTNGIQIAGNNVTVKNGTITDMTQSGALVQGSGCRIENCNFVSSTSGITLENTSQCTVEKCRIQNMSQVGVSLQNTWTSRVYGCEISGIRRVGSVYGVLAQNGGNNSVIQSIIKDLQTSSSTISAEVGGIVFDNEVASSAQNNDIAFVISLTTTAQAYGLLTRMPMGQAALIPGQPSYSGYYPQIAFDGDGNALAIWAQFDGAANQIHYARYTTGLGWGNAATIPGQPSYSGYYPQIAFDGDGNALAVWSQSNDGITEQLYYARYTAESGWSNAATIPGQLLQYGYDPQVVFDGDGNALAIWRAFDGIKNKIYYAWYTVESGWSNATILPGQRPLYNGYNPQVAFDGDGNALAVWSGYEFSSQIYYARYTAGFGWSNATTIPGQPLQNGNSPEIAVDRDGNALTVWSQSNGVINQIYYARYTVGSGWSNATAIPGQPSQDGYDPEIAFDRYGNAISVWRQSDDGVTNHTYYARYTAGLGWSNATTIPGQSLQVGFYPQVAFDGFGNTFVVWPQSDGIYYARYTAGTGWVTGTKVSGVSSLDGDGVGLCAPNRYVASNMAYECDIAFAGISSDYITSQANARGVYNIDTNLTTPDTVVVMHDEQLPTIESQLDVLAPLLLDLSVTTESKLDILSLGASTPVTAAGTLSTDYGLYCLANNIIGQLSITGTGIDFDLSGRFINANGGANGLVISGDDVMVRNGTVRNASASGVKITGNNCMLDRIVSYGNQTGFELNNVDRNIVTKCSAINNTREGYLLSSSDYNTLTKCRVINTSGAASAAGIKTTGGVGNCFDACDINGVSSSGSDAYGIVTEAEQKSNIVGCTVNGVTAACYAAGAAFIGDYVETLTISDNRLHITAYAGNIDWINTPVGSYIAMSNENPSPARPMQIASFSLKDGLSLVTEILPNPYTGANYAVKWLGWENKYYLATAGLNTGGNDIYIFKFDPATSSIVTVTGYPYYAPETIRKANNIDWVISGTIPYLVFVGDLISSTTYSVGVLGFDGQNVSFVASATAGRWPYTTNNSPISVCTHINKGRKLLAVGCAGSTGGQDLVYIFEFDNPQGSASLTYLSKALSTRSAVNDICWFDYDGRTFLVLGCVAGTATSTGVEMFIYELIGNELVLRTTYNEPGLAWSHFGVDIVVTGTKVFLGAALVVNSQEFRIYTYDVYANTLSYLYTYTDDENNAMYAARWNRIAGDNDNIYIALGMDGRTTGTSLRVLGFPINNQSSHNIIRDTTISDVIGGDGIIADTVINGIIDNRVYNCQDGLMEGVRISYPGKPFDDSNWQVPHA